MYGGVLMKIGPDKKDGDQRTTIAVRIRIKNLLKARAALAGVSLERYLEQILTSPGGKNE